MIADIINAVSSATLSMLISRLFEWQVCYVSATIYQLQETFLGYYRRSHHGNSDGFEARSYRPHCFDSPHFRLLLPPCLIGPFYLGEVPMAEFEDKELTAKVLGQAEFSASSGAVCGC